MAQAKLSALVSRFSGQTLLVIGDVMLDEVLWGEVRRISPEAPVPVVELQRQSDVPGGAANSAANVAAYGARAFLGGVVGADAQADRLRRLLVDSAIDVGGLIVEPGRPTTTKTRIVAHSQQVVRVDREERKPLEPETEQRLLAWVRQAMPGVGACVLSDYGKGVVTPTLAQGVIAIARTAGRPVVVDPKGTDYSRYRGAAVLTPNLMEAEQAAGLSAATDEALLEVAKRVGSGLPGTALLVTRGAKGMSLFGEGGVPPLHIRTEAQAVYDITGAGDTAITTLAVALAAGAGLPDAVRLANRAAGIAVGKVGTATVSREELLAVL